ncbi:MAG: putative dsRNA-binding protein [Trueperaceae bacterium]
MAHPKGLLMERLKKLGIGKPEFRTDNTGPEHQPTFLSDILVDGEVYGTGQGPTKREAERLAAEEALAFLERNPVQGVPAAGNATETLDDGGFEGPWPVFEHLLATSLEVANERTDSRLAGSEARDAVREFALSLYKELLQDLGDVVEVDEEE